MIILSQTTDNLQVVLAGAITTNQLQCFTSWRDRTDTTFVAGRTVINTNNTTDVNIAAAPAASTQRVVDFISIYNNDTANAVVTIKLDANGTEYILFKATISAGEKIEYQEGKGFSVFTSIGSVKTSINQGANAPTSSGLNTVILASNVINNNATLNTLRDVTGLSFPVVTGATYYFKFTIQFTAAATTTGSRWTIDGPTFTSLRYESDYSLTLTTRTLNTGLAAYNTPASCNLTSAATTSNIAIIEGFITPSADGNVIARFASEIANSAITAIAGSRVQYQQVL